MTNRWRKTTYEAIGFVEALIAILLVGMSSLVLLQIAINTLNTAIQNEVIDHMTQYAMEGGEMVQDIYNKQKMKGYPEEEDPEESELFFPLLEDGEDEEEDREFEHEASPEDEKEDNAEDKENE